jgi:hypothetical protein
MKKLNLMHSINENGDVTFESKNIMEILFSIGKHQFAMSLFHAFHKTGIVIDKVFNYTKFKEVDRNRIKCTRGVGNLAMRVYDELEEILADYESTQIVTMNKLEAKHREEVLKYADMVFFNKNWEQEYINAIETAEYIVNLRNQYLKDGKLC